MKESEAKTKWCPHTRLCGAAGYGASNRDIQTGWDHPKVLCIGSQCMMWESWEYESGNPAIEPTHIKNKGEGDCGLKSKELDLN